MNFRLIKNITKQGFQGMWRNRGMGTASVGSISAVLMILGLVLILILSINNLVLETKSEFDRIELYLDNDISPENLNGIESTIRENEGVLSFIYRTRDEALEIMKEEWGEEAYVLEGVEKTDALPNSYIIQLKNIEYADMVVDEIKDLKGVEGVKYYKDIIEKLILVANYIRIGGIIIIGVLIFVSIFIISNTIKITVASREREINIMKYVGATNGYIRGPFIIEGILFGLIGALISIVIINYGYGYFFESINDRLYVILTVYLVPPTSLVKDITIMFTAIGVGIGALGSIVSLKRFLNV